MKTSHEIKTSRGQSAGVHPALQFPNLPPWDCSLGGYRLFIKLRTYFMGTTRVWCSLFIRFLKLTSRKLSAWVESLYGFQTYLQGTVQPTSRDLSAKGAFFFMVTKPSSRGPLAGGGV